jgi:hypothetical protein
VEVEDIVKSSITLVSKIQKRFLQSKNRCWHVTHYVMLCIFNKRTDAFMPRTGFANGSVLPSAKLLFRKGSSETDRTASRLNLCTILQPAPPLGIPEPQEARARRRWFAECFTRFSPAGKNYFTACIYG